MKTPSTYKYLPSGLAESLRGMGIAVRRPVHGRSEGLHRSPNFGSSVEFAEYREYTPGDSINLIDWSVYARSDRYVIRRFHEETNLRAYVMLDTSESLEFQDEGHVSKMDYASYLAAGLMFMLVNQGDATGLITFDNRIRESFEPTSTFEGLRPLLLKLEDIKAGGRSDIEASIHATADMIHSRSLVIVISDLLQEPDRIARGIKRLFHDGHNIMVLHVMDGGERDLTWGGVAELRELETGRKLVVEIDEIKDAYRAAVRSYLDELRVGCAECLVDYHLVDTRTPVEEALNDLQAKPRA